MTTSPFSRLEPETILGCIEQAAGRRLLNVCRPHASYINRVYEVQDEDGEFLVAKFYRPGRWDRTALEDEHRLVADCVAHELPVIAPLELEGGGPISVCEGICFAVYPRCGGRLVDEYSDEQWLELGRLLGRLHAIGARGDAPGRNRLHPHHTSRMQIEYILANDLIPAPLVQEFVDCTRELVELITPLFEGADYIRLHGDCHSSNLIHRPGESFFIIDFDDMVVGPPIQDLWMLLPNYLEQARGEMALLLEGYELFHPFDRNTFGLIEPLRAMRFIHYINWCARQYVEDGRTLVNDNFGSFSYWQQEIADLKDQLGVIRKAL